MGSPTTVDSPTHTHTSTQGVSAMLTNLKKIRLNLNMSQNDFGDMLGFGSSKSNQSYYRKYESGQLALSAQQALIITRTFDITLKNLLK